MSEQEVRDGLAALVVDEPPLSFDPDSLMARADAATRRRRTLVGASSATLVVAAAAIALPIALRGGSGPTSGGVATPAHGGTVVTTTQAKPKFQWPPAHYPTPRYTVAQLQALGHQLQAEAKGIFMEAVPAASGITARVFAGESSTDYHDGQLTLNGSISYQTNAGKAAVDIEIFAGATGVGPGDACENDKGKHCQKKYLEDGSMTVSTSWQQDGTKAQTIRHYRLDGVVVIVTGYNNDGFNGELVHNLPKIPVSTAQLTKIAMDPDLTM